MNEQTRDWWYRDNKPLWMGKNKAGLSAANRRMENKGVVFTEKGERWTRVSGRMKECSDLKSWRYITIHDKSYGRCYVSTPYRPAGFSIIRVCWTVIILSDVFHLKFIKIKDFFFFNRLIYPENLFLLAKEKAPNRRLAVISRIKFFLGFTKAFIPEIYH